MTYKTISVSLNEISRAEPLLNFAGDLAQDQDAHLVGLYVIPAVRIYPDISGAVAPVVIEEYREFFQNRSEQVREIFEDITRRMGLRSEWRSVNSSSPLISDSTIDHGRESDLIIVSEVCSPDETGIEADFMERIVMASGRPVLLVPKSGVVRPLQGNALVGWNGSREAARAAFDAIPLLKRMDKVTIIWVDPQKVFEAPGAVPGAELAVVLARHGISAVAEGFSTAGLSEGQALSMRARDLGANLLVMGAYGHTRLREYVFGGATRFMLNEVLIPTLMSH
jgi:nucleotide-binding universal stress UspA family protein